MLQRGAPPQPHHPNHHGYSGQGQVSPTCYPHRVKGAAASPGRLRSDWLTASAPRANRASPRHRHHRTIEPQNQERNQERNQQQLWMWNSSPHRKWCGRRGRREGAGLAAGPPEHHRPPEHRPPEHRPPPEHYRPPEHHRPPP
ncbi:hypothetical protein CRUP_029445 [Coryphaenoides rupestris]|nr:hypothetical protein CRUP_029445 [Coryphaenoides rupestris]